MTRVFPGDAIAALYCKDHLRFQGLYEWMLSGCTDETSWKTLIKKHMRIYRLVLADLSCKMLRMSLLIMSLGLDKLSNTHKIPTSDIFISCWQKTKQATTICSDLYLRYHHYWRCWRRRSEKSDFLSLQMNVCTEILTHTKKENIFCIKAEIQTREVWHFCRNSCAHCHVVFAPVYSSCGIFAQGAQYFVVRVIHTMAYSMNGDRIYQCSYDLA